MLANLISRILLILTMMVGTVLQLVAVEIQPSMDVQESITKNMRPPISTNINLVRPARDGLRANTSKSLNMKIQKFFVGIKEVHTSTVAVMVEVFDGEPDYELEARILKAAKIEADNLDSLDIEYSHTLDPDRWTINKAQ